MDPTEEVNTVTFEIEDKDDARKICEILAMNGYKVKTDSFTSPYLVYVDIVVVTEENTLEKINSWVADMVSFFGKGGRLNHDPQNWSKSSMEEIVDRAATEETVDPTPPSDTPYVYSDGVEIKHNYGETKSDVSNSTMQIGCLIQKNKELKAQLASHDALIERLVSIGKNVLVMFPNGIVGSNIINKLDDIICEWNAIKESWNGTD